MESGDIMVNYQKMIEVMKEKGINTTIIQRKRILPQSTLRKIRKCSGNSFDEIKTRLNEYKQAKGKDFQADVTMKTIEDICQLLQCQPFDLIDWHVDLDPKLSYENRFKNDKEKEIEPESSMDNNIDSDD